MGLVAAVLVGVPGVAALGVLVLLAFHLTAGRWTREVARAPHPSELASA